MFRQGEISPMWKQPAHPEKPAPLVAPKHELCPKKAEAALETALSLREAEVEPGTALS